MDGCYSVSASCDFLLNQFRESSLNTSWIWCESDFKQVIHLCLLHLIPQHHRFAMIIANIHHLLRQSWSFHPSNVFHEGNSYVDLLAKYSITQVRELKVWQVPLPDFSSALLVDTVRVTFWR
ncbi:hypothetical protein VNO78_20441 [Psophocarpus tetragonolobus]|uniref:RNase H type-1 domain-containing protein n=1 Tax=Psophocarpus tetragonolobus TaxID=3891 RepID=A0AAN9SBE8_PSOTE